MINSDVGPDFLDSYEECTIDSLNNFVKEFEDLQKKMDIIKHKDCNAKTRLNLWKSWAELVRLALGKYVEKKVFVTAVDQMLRLNVDVWEANRIGLTEKQKLQIQKLSDYVEHYESLMENIYTILLNLCIQLSKIKEIIN